MKFAVKVYYRIILLALIFLPLQEIRAQSDSLFSFVRTYESGVSSFAIDNLGELYVINRGNQLKKYDSQGDSVAVFNQVTQFGNLSYVQAQNPWKTILFYQDFGTIVLLDKYLNIVTSINLPKLNIFQVEAVTTSYDNNIWLFDGQEEKLKKIDDNGNTLFESVDFRQLFDSVPSPRKLIDRDGYVYLYDPDKGVYIFDYYGNFKTRLPFLHWTDIAVTGKKIYGFDKTHFFLYNPPVPDATQYDLPRELEGNHSVKVNNSMMYVLKNGELKIYRIL
jgi:hypothetical protein